MINFFFLQMAEYRVSIYGRKQSEWDQLASWVVNNDLYSENVVWLIQVYGQWILDYSLFWVPIPVALSCNVIVSLSIFSIIQYGAFISFQIPRLYNIYKDMGIVTSFQNMLDNIFLPLFEVTVDPNSHPHLHLFLKQVNTSTPSHRRTCSQ